MKEIRNDGGGGKGNDSSSKLESRLKLQNAATQLEFMQAKLSEATDQDVTSGDDRNIQTNSKNGQH